MLKNKQIDLPEIFFSLLIGAIIFAFFFLISILGIHSYFIFIVIILIVIGNIFGFSLIQKKVNKEKLTIDLTNFGTQSAFLAASSITIGWALFSEARTEITTEAAALFIVSSVLVLMSCLMIAQSQYPEVIGAKQTDDLKENQRNILARKLLYICCIGGVVLGVILAWIFGR